MKANLESRMVEGEGETTEMLRRTQHDNDGRRGRIGSCRARVDEDGHVVGHGKEVKLRNEPKCVGRNWGLSWLGDRDLGVRGRCGVWVKTNPNVL
jgi:hypothetical protein